MVDIVGMLRDLWVSWKRILRLAKKPDDDEFKLALKLTMLGFLVVGGIAYIIHLIATWFKVSGGI